VRMNVQKESPRLEPAPPAKETHILIVDDEQQLRNLLSISLRKDGYHIYEAADGLKALDVFSENHIDLILLDIMMPELDGFETCAELRKISDVPIIMLTALNRPDDIVHGFDIGADDYITKPFTFREVSVRIQAILRRIAWINERPEFRVISHNGIVLNDEVHEVTVRGQPVHLTPIEYDLLRHLMSSPDRPVSKNELFQNVWGYDLAGGTNLVEVAIRRLREKIEPDPSTPIYLVTVRSAGYKFVAQPTMRNTDDTSD